MRKYRSLSIPYLLSTVSLWLFILLCQTENNRDRNIKNCANDHKQIHSISLLCVCVYIIARDLSNKTAPIKNLKILLDFKMPWSFIIWSTKQQLEWHIINFDFYSLQAKALYSETAAGIFYTALLPLYNKTGIADTIPVFTD